MSAIGAGTENLEALYRLRPRGEESTSCLPDTGAVQPSPRSTMSASMSGLASNPLTGSEICSLLGISNRAFKQMRALKAVDAANGTGKSARYTASHVDQAQRLLKMMAVAGLSMPAAAARLHVDAGFSKASKVSKLRLAVEACFRGSVYNLGSGVYLAVDPQARSGLQSHLLKELKSCAAIIRGLHSEKPKATASVMRSRVHRTR